MGDAGWLVGTRSTAYGWMRMLLRNDGRLHWGKRGGKGGRWRETGRDSSYPWAKLGISSINEWVKSWVTGVTGVLWLNVVGRLSIDGMPKFFYWYILHNYVNSCETHIYRSSVCCPESATQQVIEYFIASATELEWGAYRNTTQRDREVSRS